MSATDTRKSRARIIPGRGRYRGFLLAVFLCGMASNASAVVPGHLVVIDTAFPDQPAGYQGLKSPIQVDEDGGPDASYYWFSTYWFESDNFGYMGLQNRSGPRWVNFSIWEATSWENGAGNCKFFDHEGSGVQCEMPYDWDEGTLYEMEVVKVAADVWQGSVRNKLSGERTVIARITVPSGWGNLQGSVVSVVEEFSQGAVELASCDAIASSSAVFQPSNMDGVAPSDVGSRTSDNCAHKAQTACDAGQQCTGTVNGRQAADTAASRVNLSPENKEPIENSVRADIDSDTLSYLLFNESTNTCTAIEPGTREVRQQECNGEQVQEWEEIAVDSGFMLRNIASGQCLDVAGSSQAEQGAVLHYSCHGNPNQVLSREGSSLKFNHSGKCLDLNGEGDDGGAVVQQLGCNGSEAQMFSNSAIAPRL